MTRRPWSSILLILAASGCAAPSLRSIDESIAADVVHRFDLAPGAGAQPIPVPPSRDQQPAHIQ